MKKNLVFAFLLWVPFVGAQASEQTAYEMPRTQVVPIKAGAADKQYELYIKLPEDYADNTDKKYPVIYTTDAVWHMDLLSGSTEYLMPNVILVGISWQQDGGDEEAHKSRARDYTLYPSSDPERQAKNRHGQAANHLSFIRDNVIKYVESHYRADPGERTYLGYSLGAAFGAYILFSEPGTFKHYILGSPALGERSLKYIDELEAKMAPKQQGLGANVFVSIGELEKSERMVHTKDFITVLQRRSQAGLRLAGLEIIEGSDHGTAVPETFSRGIKWLSQLTSE